MQGRRALSLRHEYCDKLAEVVHAIRTEHGIRTNTSALLDVCVSSLTKDEIKDGFVTALIENFKRKSKK